MLMLLSKIPSTYVGNIQFKSDEENQAKLWHRLQGSLFRGIEIWSGSVYNELKSSFDNSFVTQGFDP